MSDHVSEWLNAYLDGELGNSRLRQVEAHLDGCGACRAELDGLRSLTGLLRETPPQAVFVPAGRFAANLTLKLPRRPEVASPRRLAGLAWWLPPAMTLSAWIFGQLALGLSSVISVANAAGLLDGVSAWLAGGERQTIWFAAAMQLFGAEMAAAHQTTLSFLNLLNFLGVDLLSGFLWQAAIALAYWTWLALWWRLGRNRQTLDLELTSGN